MKLKEDALYIVLILAAAVVLVTLIGGLIVQATHENDNSTKFKVACVQAGKTWSYDQGYNGVCK